MAKYKLIKKRDGTYNVIAVLKMGRLVVHRSAVKGVPPSGLRAAVEVLSTELRQVRKARGLTETDVSKPGRTR